MGTVGVGLEGSTDGAVGLGWDAAEAGAATEDSTDMDVDAVEAAAKGSTDTAAGAKAQRIWWWPREGARRRRRRRAQRIRRRGARRWQRADITLGRRNVCHGARGDNWPRQRRKRCRKLELASQSVISQECD